MNGKQINLQKLFDAVVERGGYDVVSAEKLAWRKVGQEFGLGSSNAAAYAFALKTVYYKNLAYVRCIDPPEAFTHILTAHMRSKQSITKSRLRKRSLRVLPLKVVIC